jgi:hypothetical protein
MGWPSHWLIGLARDMMRGVLLDLGSFHDDYLLTAADEVALNIEMSECVEAEARGTRRGYLEKALYLDGTGSSTASSLRSKAPKCGIHYSTEGEKNLVMKFGSDPITQSEC